ncbi:MAG: DUF4007 family protein [Alphaproteobacteria bacterium]|nr:DUF4007 family protein [Alphaproteobacteria bacterium]
MKFRGYETFSLRKGWLNKGIAAIREDGRVFYQKDSTPMDRLGLGSNMVKSLRYWLFATQLIKEEYIDGRKEMVLTPIGQAIWNNDQYFQEDGTWQIIHYLLSSNQQLATSWFFVFNIFNVTEFTKEDFQEALVNYILSFEKEPVPSERSISDDFDCVLHTYYNKKDDIDPESNMVCPLTSLNLLSVNDKSVNKLKIKPENLNPYVAFAILVNESIKKETNELRISDIEKAPCNLGRTFNMDSISVSRVLDDLRNIGLIRVTRTAGLDIVKIVNHRNFMECIEDYYNSIR